MLPDPKYKDRKWKTELNSVTLHQYIRNVSLVVRRALQLDNALIPWGAVVPLHIPAGIAQRRQNETRPCHGLTIITGQHHTCQRTCHNVEFHLANALANMLPLWVLAPGISAARSGAASATKPLQHTSRHQTAFVSLANKLAWAAWRCQTGHAFPSSGSLFCVSH